MTRRNRKSIPAVMLALALATPAVTFAATPFRARLEVTPGNFTIKSIRSASLQARATNRSGANGLLVRLKVSGAVDFTDTPANVDLKFMVGFDSLPAPNCHGSIHLPVSIVNGSLNVTFTGTDLGVSEQNFLPGRELRLCIAPELFQGGDPSKTVLGVNLYSQTPGVIVQGSFVRNDVPGNPITSWKTAKFRVQSANGATMVSTSISGAMEGSVPSNRIVIPLIPAFDGVFSCDPIPYFLYSVVLENGRGKSLIPNINNGGSDPGRCLSAATLEDSSLNQLAFGLGIIQGTDPD
jgi:hypothetical protein